MIIKKSPKTLKSSPISSKNELDFKNSILILKLKVNHESQKESPDLKNLISIFQKRVTAVIKKEWPRFKKRSILIFKKPFNQKSTKPLFLTYILSQTTLKIKIKLLLPLFKNTLEPLY